MSQLLELLSGPDVFEHQKEIVDYIHNHTEEYGDLVADVFGTDDSDSLQIKNRLLDLVDMMSDKTALVLMKETLTDSEERIRVRGLQSVYRRRVDSMNDQIAEIMLDRDEAFEVRKWTVHILSSTDPTAFGTVLRRVAKTQEEDVLLRKEAIFSLTKVICDETLGALCATLGDPDIEIRKAGAWALANIGSANGICCLLSALEDINEGVRDWAIRGLRDMDDGRALQGLADALHNVEPKEQVRIIRLVIEKRSEIILRAVAELLQSPDTGVRRQAAWAMGVSPYPPAAPELEFLLNDEDEEVRTYAEKALVRLGHIDPTEFGFKL